MLGFEKGMMHSRNFREATAQEAPDLQYIDIDLSVARDLTEIQIGGGAYFYAATSAFDSARVISTTKTVGQCLIGFGNQAASPVIVQGGMRYQMPPVYKLFVTNVAQAGKMVRLYYSTEADISSLLAADVSLAANVNVLTDYNAHRFGAIEYNAYPTTITVGTYLAPGSNPGGVILRSVVTWQSPTSQAALKFGTSAPTDSLTGGRMIARCDPNGPILSMLFPNMLIPAGNGIYHCNDVAVATRVWFSFDPL